MSAPIEASELCRLRTPVDVAVSPDGSRVAFTTTEWDQASDEQRTGLYVVPTDGSADPHRLTRASDGGPPRWSADGSKLGFVATREEDYARQIGPTVEDEDEADDDEAEAQVWAFDLERGGDAIQLTDREWGVREFDWGPAGERIVISARDPTDEQEEYLERREDAGPVEIERLQHKLDGVGFTDDVTTYLFVVDLATGETERLEETAGAGAFEQMAGVSPTWQPHGEQVAFLNAVAEDADDTMAREVHLVDVDSGEVSALTAFESVCSPPSWSPDGDRLVLHTRDAINWYLPVEVRVIDPTDGEVTTLTDGLDATVSWFGSPRFLDPETVVAGMGDAGRTRLYRFAADGSTATVADLGFDDDVASLRAYDTGGGMLGYVVSDPSTGDDVYAAAADLADTRRLSTLNESFFADHPGPAFRRLVTDTDGIEVESMVYHPPTFDPADPDPHPTIVWPHGGPMSYDDPEYSFAFAYFTSRGFIVVKPNYRGSTSYGGEFGDILNGRWGTVDVEDTLAVVDDCIDRGWTDDDRLFSAGFSYGGILTGFLVTQSDRFTAAAAEHGIYDLRAEFGTSDSHNWMGNEFGLPWEARDRYDASSSILDVEAVDTPTLVTAGAEDWRCPPTQSEQFYVSLRKQGVPAKLVVYPGEHHNVSTPERAIHRLETIADWFETHDPTIDTESA